MSVTEINFPEGTRLYSIWADYVDKACCTDSLTESAPDSHQAIFKFLECVSKKLDRNVVKNELLYHNNGGGKVIARAASTGNLQILQAMSAYLENGLEALRNTFCSTVAVTEGIWARNGWESLTKHFLGINDQGVATNLDGFSLLSLCFLEKFSADELDKLIEFISFVNENQSSIWSD